MDVHPTELPPEELLRECDERRTRRSGPGGQHRNKVETAVELLHRPTGVMGSAGERRSQAENRKIALGRLRINLALAVRVERRNVSDVWRQRCQGGRLVVSDEHEDFARMLAEALDVVSEENWNLGDAALRLGCSASQLGKMIKRVTAAWERLNQEREKRGLQRLR